MRSRLLLASLMLLSVSHCWAQITTSTRTLRVIEAPPGSVFIGQVDAPQYLVLPDNADGKRRSTVQITYDGVQSESPDIEAFDYKTRQPVQVTKIGSAQFLVFGEGKVEVILTDWDARDKNRLVVNVPPSDDDGDDGGSDDDGGQDDDQDPLDPPDVDVRDEYGVGSVSYQYAVKDDPVTNDKYQRIYRSAAGFLFGIPTPKAIIAEGEPDFNNPDRSVIAWMQKEGNMIQCRDEETCKAWAKWRDQVAAATNQAQLSRSFTRNDWRAVFLEAADALEAAK